ncbi:hypothetical protein OO013_16605 [Mangrovivirga sp. M17]|uniref:Uncharacterized protein n=1 Tax=Mangrovivirga halotolerans TaxID=2993936 RepID=A0ABT3RV43_9BACT|nr:hypothetical protein [Mangrovivirga halotolerans]MCX2745503.1 hypothetical protein [Mangrovivirga halotolerans]
MKKAFKIIGVSLLIILISGIGIGVYFYQTNPRLQAIVNNDESVLYYFPAKEMKSMDDLNYTESILTVEDSLKIYTYQFQPEIEKKQMSF